MPINTLKGCPERFGIAERPPCKKGVDGDCRLEAAFTLCLIFHERLVGIVDHDKDHVQERLKDTPMGFDTDKYTQEVVADLTARVADGTKFY